MAVSQASVPPRQYPITPAFLPLVLACEIEGSGEIEDRLVNVKFGNEGHGLLHVGAFIAQFHVALDAIEKGRSNGQKTILGIAVRHRADMLVDPEDLLHNHQPANRFAGRPRHISSENMAVRCLQCDSLAHGSLHLLWQYPR